MMPIYRKNFGIFTIVLLFFKPLTVKICTQRSKKPSNGKKNGRFSCRAVPGTAHGPTRPTSPPPPSSTPTPPRLRPSRAPAAAPPPSTPPLLASSSATPTPRLSSHRRLLAARTAPPSHLSSPPRLQRRHRASSVLAAPSSRLLVSSAPPHHRHRATSSSPRPSLFSFRSGAHAAPALLPPRRHGAAAAGRWRWLSGPLVPCRACWVRVVLGTARPTVPRWRPRHGPGSRAGPARPMNSACRAVLVPGLQCVLRAGPFGQH